MSVRDAPSVSTDPLDGVRGYLPIEHYGAIGNLHTVALVGRNGSIDWCSLPELDRPSVFGGILDAGRGGRFRVSLPGGPLGEQRYRGDTNVLETSFQSPSGRLEVIDFMPISGNIDGRRSTPVAPEIHRILHAPGGDVEVDVEWAPRPDYARIRSSIEPRRGGFVALGGEEDVHLVGVPDGALERTGDAAGPVVSGRLPLRAGTSVLLVTSWGEPDPATSLDRSMSLLEETETAWERWAHKEEATGQRAWGGPWRQLIIRSELALKLLTHADSGAFAAAGTTSLPEVIGGVRNWDYRYCWLRDAAMTADAFLAMGHHDEMRDFVLWATRASEQSVAAGRTLHIMYGLHGEVPPAAQDLDHLHGYRESQPVQIGNDAVDQLQLDVFGELLDCGFALVRAGYALEPDVAAFLPQVADRAAERWHEADHGLWEMPLEPRQYTYSKLMAWVALDRALRLEAEGHIHGDVDAWHAGRDGLAEWLVNVGFDRHRGAFVQRGGAPDLDASSLMIPVLGFLPPDDPRVQATIDLTLQELTEHDLVYRYRVDDGLPGEEGTFVLCTWWLVDALALAGRVEEAERIFEGLIRRVNHVGLLSEQIDATSGAFLGNFPQAFSHIGLITSTANLARAQGEEVPGPRLFPAPDGR